MTDRQPFMPGAILVLSTTSFAARSFTVVSDSAHRTVLRGARGGQAVLVEEAGDRDGLYLVTEGRDRTRSQPCTIEDVVGPDDATPLPTAKDSGLFDIGESERPSDRAMREFFDPFGPGKNGISRKESAPVSVRLESGLTLHERPPVFASPLDRARVAADDAIHARAQAGDCGPRLEVELIDAAVEALQRLRRAIIEQEDLVLE